MPVLDAQSSIPFTLLEKQMMGGEVSDMREEERGDGEGRGSGERRVLEDEREAPSS
jgi:hypothetical protein